LCSLKLVDKREGCFWNTPETSALLVAGKPDYLAGLLHGVHLWDSWSTLTAAVKKGGAVGSGPVNDRGEEWLTAFIAAMHWRASAQAGAIASMVGVRENDRVLDVGGGSGAYAMAFCRQADGVTATVLDLPNVIPITRGYLEKAGMAGVVETVAGDYETSGLPHGYDLVWLSAIVHSNGPERNAELIAKAAASVNSRGRVAVQEFVMDPDRTSPAFGALFALNMLVATDSGDTYTESEIADWMKKAGLVNVTRHDTPFGTALVVGEKP
ncbi:MAG: acetylserotonin O-methyltransferase, partial [Proteobacteria bacterium]|nr:acetylserotonin O-methyltransferase [Pseudomonadota bacterium]